MNVCNIPRSDNSNNPLIYKLRSDCDAVFHSLRSLGQFPTDPPPEATGAGVSTFPPPPPPEQNNCTEYSPLESWYPSTMNVYRSPSDTEPGIVISPENEVSH